MPEKESNDFVVRMPDSRDDEKVPFVATKAGGEAINRLSNNGPLSVVAYCLASMSMTLVNKYVVSGSFWNLNFFYLAVQAVVSTSSITAAKQMGLIKDLSDFNPEKAKKLFPIAVLLVGQIYTGTKSLQFLSVPVYTIFKNLTIIVIAYGEVLWFGGSVTPLALLSFGLMVLSSVVAAWADIQSAISGDFASTAAVSTLNAGYAWMGVNVIFNASYVLCMRKVVKKMNVSDWDTTYYNNLLSVPVLAVCSILTEDWSSTNFALNFPIESRNHLIIGMIYSGLGAIFISYCIPWCIRATSSTTYSMAGALNKLPLAVAGLVFFSAPVTVGSVSAIILGFISGIVYAWAKTRSR